MKKTTYGNRAKKSKSRTDGLITPWALIMMSVLMLYSFGNITSNYVGLGWSAAPAFIVAILIYLLPFSFIIAELATLKIAKNSNAGFMKWIEAGVGRKMAFITSYMFWFANLFYFVGSTPGSITNLAYAFTGKDVTGSTTFNDLVPYLALLLFAIVTWISTWNVKKMSIITSTGGTIILVLTFLFFAIAFVGLVSGDWGKIVEGVGDDVGAASHPYWTFFTNTDGHNYVLSMVDGEGMSEGHFYSYHITKAGEVIIDSDQGTIDLVGGINLQVQTGSNLENWYYFPQGPGMENGTSQPNFWGDAGGFNYVWFSTFVWVLMAADGAQGLGVYVNKVEGGSKQFSKSLAVAILMIGTIYVFGTLLVSVFAPTGLANGKYTSFSLMFYYALGPIFGTDPATKATIVGLSNHIIGIVMFIAGTGGLLLWTSAPVKTFFSEIPAGVFGSGLTKQNKNGSPYRAAWLQFFIVVPLLLIPAFGNDGLEDFLEAVKTMSGSIGMIPPLIIFFAYFMIRLKHDDLERGFKMGPRWFGLIVSAFIMVIFTWILFMSYFPYSGEGGFFNDKDMWFMVAYQTIGLIVFVLPVYFWYAWYERNQRLISIAEAEGKDVLLASLKTKGNKNAMSVFFNEEIRIARDKKIDDLNKKFEKLYSYEEKKSIKEWNEYSKAKLDAVENKVKFEGKKPSNLKATFKKLDKEYNLFKKEILKEFKDLNNELMEVKAEEAKTQFNELKEKGLFNKENEVKAHVHNTKWNVSIDDVNIPSENEIVAEMPAMRDYSISPQNTITDKVILTKDEIIVVYVDGGKYAADSYLLKDTVIESNDKVTYVNENGEEVKLESIKLTNHDYGNVFIENIFITKPEVFIK